MNPPYSTGTRASMAVQSPSRTSQLVRDWAFFSMPQPMVALPCGSRSISKTRLLVAVKEAARLTAVVVLPTPPFWFAMAMTRFMGCSVWVGFDRVPQQASRRPVPMERIGPDRDNLRKNLRARTPTPRGRNDMANELNSLEGAKSELIGLAIHFGPKLLTAIVILTAGEFVGGWVARATARGLHRLDLEPPVRQLLTRVARLIVLAVFAMMALQNLGVELLPLIAGIGVAGAGVALATQGVLSNMVAGLTIIFTKPYRVGDYVAIVGVEGQVENITLFSTELRHADRSRVVVPNRKVVGEILHN